MVRITLKHRPGHRPRPGGGAPAGGRAPAIPSPRLRRKRRGNLRRFGHLQALLAAVAVAGVCALAACALVAPGFVLGAEGSAVDSSAQRTAAPPSFDSAPPRASALGAPTTSRTVGDETTPSKAAIEPVHIATAVPTGGHLLVTLPWGAGPGEVGLLAPGEGLARGPEALAVAPDGRIAVLDSVNGRLLFLDPNGQPAGTAAVPLTSPRFLAVDDRRLYVLDCDVDRRLITFDWGGADLGATALPEVEDVVTGLLATDYGPCLEIAHETTLVLTQTGAALQASAASGSGPARVAARTVAGRPTDRSLSRVSQVTFKPGRNARIKLFTIDATTSKPAQTRDWSPVLADGRAIEHLVSVDGDAAGRLIIGARLLKAAAAQGQRAPLALTRVAMSEDQLSARDAGQSSVEVADTLLLADSPFAYLGQPYVVAPDGRIFQPWASEAGYSILIHSFMEAEEVQQ